MFLLLWLSLEYNSLMFIFWCLFFLWNFSFKTNYPNWEPDVNGKQLMSQLSAFRLRNDENVLAIHCKQMSRFPLDKAVKPRHVQRKQSIRSQQTNFRVPLLCDDWLCARSTGFSGMRNDGFATSDLWFLKISVILGALYCSETHLKESNFDQIWVRTVN